MEIDASPDEDVTTSQASALRDDKFYKVTEETVLVDTIVSVEV